MDDDPENNAEEVVKYIPEHSGTQESALLYCTVMSIMQKTTLYRFKLLNKQKIQLQKPFPVDFRSVSEAHKSQ